MFLFDAPPNLQKDCLAAIGPVCNSRRVGLYEGRSDYPASHHKVSDTDSMFSLATGAQSPRSRAREETQQSHTLQTVGE